MKTIDIIVGRISGFGGVENVISDWFKNLSDNFKLRLVLPIGTEDDQWLKGKRCLLNEFTSISKAIIYLNGLWFTIRYLLKCKSDILVIENYRIVLLASLIKKVFKKKYIVISWMHQSLDVKKNMAKFLKYADYHFAIASGIERQLLNVGISKKKIFLIFNPVKRETKSIKVDQNFLKLIYIGRPLLDGQKNLRELLDTIATLKIKYWLYLYGVSNENFDIVNYINNLGIEDKVTLKGWKNDPWSDIKSATCLVLTSKFEGLGLVLLESISYGLPVIASDVKVGPKDIVQNGVNGYLYELGNKRDLLKKIMLVFKNSDLKKKDKLKNSISQFYEDNYYKTLKSLLANIS